MSSTLKHYGSIDQAAASLQQEILENTGREQISESESLAQDQRKATEDIGKTLTNIKEFLYSKLYDVLLGMYDIFANSPWADKGQRALSAFDRQIRMNQRKQADLYGDLAKETDPARKAAIQKQIDDLETANSQMDNVRKQIEGLSEDEFGDLMQSTVGSKDLDTYLRAEIGQGVSGGGRLGTVGGTTARGRVTAMTDAERAARVEEKKAAGATRAVLRDDAVSAANSLMATSGWTPGDLIGDARYDEFKKMGNISKLPNEVQAALYMQAAGILGADVNGTEWFSIQRYMGAIATLAEGGVVTRPTFSLIGEGGEPEAVIPLSKMGNLGGGVNIHIHGGIYELDRVKKIIQGALLDYERSQRV